MSDFLANQLSIDDLVLLYEDEHILAIHKPEGVPFHSDDNEVGIVQKVRKGLQTETLFPIHRLDKITSGLMIFAKTEAANKDLSVQLANKTLEKYYLAVSAKKPLKKQGLVSGDMEKGRRGSYLLKRDKNNPAKTRFFAQALKTQVKEQYIDASNNAWLYILKPETGKTHQLRVALKSLASPVFGDRRYGPDEADRGYLHAYKMRFELFGKRYDICDQHFSGKHFNLAWLRDECDFLQPETLAWPKPSFLLKP